MSLDRQTSPEFRGIKRIQQACLNCRRKKAKCSGERPICGYCKRLGQECEYWAKPRTTSTANDQQEQTDASQSDHSVSYNDEALSNRVAAIECKLDQLMNTLNGYLPTIVNQGNVPSLATPASLPSLSSLQSHSVPGNGFSLTGVSSRKENFTELPPMAVILSLVDVYFSRVHNQPYSFFHEQNFRRRLSENALPNYLVFAILASALRFSDDPFFDGAVHEAATFYARQSWKHIVMEWFATESDPDLFICQAITLLSIIDFTAGRRHPAWLKIGLSIRIAQDLRLMMEPDTSLSYPDQEERRRVFWSIYVLDRLCSCGRARPASIIDDHCRVQLPCSEASFRNGECEKTQTLERTFAPGKKVAVKLGHLALVVLTASIIGKCAQHGIHDHSQEASRLPPWDSKSEFASIYSVLLQLETQFEMGSRIANILATNFLVDGVIDTHMAGPYVFSHTLFHMCQCLLHHPYLLYNQSRALGVKTPASFLNRALQTCREHANALSTLIQDTNNAGYLVQFSFMGYCVTVIASIHMLCLQSEDNGIRQSATYSLQSDINFLNEFSRYWRTGQTMLATLQKYASQISFYSTLITTSPQLENLSASQLEDLWAAVDYSSMCYKTEAAEASLGYSNPTIHDWNLLLGLDVVQLSGEDHFSRLNYLAASHSFANEPLQRNHVDFGDMSTMDPFFNNESMQSRS